MKKFASNRILAPVTLRRQRHWLAAGMLIWVGLLSGTAPAAVQKGRSAPTAIFDTDVDFDNTMAFAALAQQHLSGAIDLRAVTITNNGAGLPAKGYQHVPCLLDSLGLTQVAVADATYPLPNAFP